MQSVAAVGGIVVVDKPAGISSAKVVAALKKASGAKKAGHTGTLDPFATGVLVCCLNQATRLAGFLLKGDKCYEALIRLGVETDTQDITGEVIARAREVTVGEDQIRRVVEGFQGRIRQLPPVYSALKHRGVPLYRLARRGTPVQKPPREVTIDSIRVLSVALPHVRLAIQCSAGTYVRTLSADIGRTLGCGGYLKALRRLASSGFSIEEALSLEMLEELAGKGALTSRVIPMTRALKGMPKVIADKVLAQKISHGQRLGHGDIERIGKVPAGQQPTGKIQVIDQRNRLIAVLERPTAGKRAKSYNYCCVFHYENAE
jgi:tRNA pseudouridine55 synthase